MRHPYDPDPTSLDGDCRVCSLGPDTHAPVYADLPDVPEPPADLGVDDSHLKFPCPECGAGAHYDCEGRFGSYYKGHRARRELAKQVVSRA